MTYLKFKRIAALLVSITLILGMAGVFADDYVTITLHAGEMGYFDGAAKEIQSRQEKGKTFTEDAVPKAWDENLVFIGWAKTADAASPDPDIYKDNNVNIIGTDLFAVYSEKNMLYLNANGGVFPYWRGDVTVWGQQYLPDTVFKPEAEPQIEGDLEFAGWSKRADAKEPDKDIIEGVTKCGEIGTVLFAVYAEKVTETFDANGGYIGDESTAALQTAKGKGHIFRGVEIKSADPRKTPLGWIDQSGTAIPYTTDNYPLYRVNEDTVYTTVWGYDLYIDANGGVFPSVGVDRLKITMEYEGAFSLANAEGLGEAVSYSSKEFLGWATTPDAPEPDIRDGITPVKELDVVYAVWKDGKYYFDEGGNAYLNKQTGDSLGFIIKSREEGKASEIAGVSVDGVPMSEENFTAEGMALSLKNDYLSGLDDGNHTVTVKFADGEVKALFTVGNDNGLPALLPPPAAEFSPVETKSPETQDAPAAVPKANNSKTPYIKPKSNISSSSGKKTTNNTGGKKQSSNTAAEPVQYTVTKGGDGVYIKGGGKYTVVVKRSTDDGNCLDHYIETLIDGDAAEAEVLRGSAVITFDGKTLDKLAAGEHIICAVFDDGTAETSLTVEEKSAEALTTQTNTDGGEKEPLSPSARAGITAGCVTLAALAAYLIRKIIKERKRKKRQEQRLKEREGLSE